MTTTVVNFVQSTIAPFQFQPTMNGVQYAASILWNVFGERYYLQLTDLLGNPVKFRSVVSSGPRLLGSFVWADNVAAVNCQVPHNIPVGACANVVMSGTASSFDGSVQVLAVSATAVTYALTTNPQQSQPLTGTMSFVVNLVEGAGIGFMHFFSDSQTYEYGP